FNGASKDKHRVKAKKNISYNHFFEQLNKTTLGRKKLRKLKLRPQKNQIGKTICLFYQINKENTHQILKPTVLNCK
nr:hypothetical protein [Vibrio vulnificus]